MPDPSRPPTPSPLLRVPLFWQLQLAGWSGFMLLSLPLKVTVYDSMPAALLITAYQLPLSITLTCLLRLFFRRVRPTERALGSAAALVLAGCMTAGALDVLVSLPVNHYFGFFGPAEILSAGLFFFRTAIYLIWTLAYVLIKSLLASRAQAFQAAVAEERHRFELLRYQLNPGFLARSLATISHEIGQNPAAARAMTARLADFYRSTVRQADQQRATTIGDEIALVRAYLEIERLRQPETLRIRFALEDALLAQSLPPILLLPLVEKAVNEGRGTAAQPLEIIVTVQRATDGLTLLEVANSGRLGQSRAPMPVTAENGVADVRASLERHYPGRYRFALSQDSLQTRATVCVPPGT
jgi:hypothetical protein